MYFIVDNDKKVIFGWNPKCGCTHIKTIYLYLTGKEVNIDNMNYDKLHSLPWDKLPFNINDYTIIIIIRNPYERLVSGYIDKYKENGEFRNRWNNNIPLTFNNFVNELLKNDYKHIENHHFSPQLNAYWQDSVRYHKKLHVYDLKNINYSLIESLYSIKLPSKLLYFKGPHESNKIYNYGNNIEIYHKTNDYYKDKLPIVTNFYNTDIADKVYNFYKKDFDFFKSLGFNYSYF